MTSDMLEQYLVCLNSVFTRNLLCDINYLSMTISFLIFIFRKLWSRLSFLHKNWGQKRLDNSSAGSSYRTQFVLNCLFILSHFPEYNSILGFLRDSAIEPFHWRQFTHKKDVLCVQRMSMWRHYTQWFIFSSYYFSLYYYLPCKISPWLYFLAKSSKHSLNIYNSITARNCEKKLRENSKFKERRKNSMHSKK